MKKFLLAALAGASIFSIQPAHAEEGFMGLNLYGSLSGGMTITRDSNWDDAGLSGDISLDNGFHFEGALGLNVTKNVRTELEVSYRSADLSDITVDGVGSASLDGDLTTWAVLINGYYDFMPDAQFNPWLSAGLGFARHDGEVNSVGSVGLTGVSASDTVFAYQLGAGADYNISKSTALFAGYRYFATSTPDFDGLEADYSAHEFRVGVRQKFN